MEEYIDGTDVPAPVLLPCGCFISSVLENGERVMMVEVCVVGCKWVAYILQQADELDKPVEVRQ